MSRSSHALNYAVRLPVLAWHGGRMAWALVPLPLVPALVAIALEQPAMAAALGGGALGLLVLGALLRVTARRAASASVKAARRGREPMPGPETNEAMVLAALAFIGPGLFMGWALTKAGVPLGPALFEGVSGMTTTGLSLIAAPEALPWPVLFARAWMQWYGGLGIVVLAVALVVGRETAVARALSEIQPIGESLAESLRQRARRSLYVYGSLSLACVVATWAAGASWEQALLYGMTAVSTAGFAPHSASLAALPGPAPAVVLMAFAFAGAVSFSVYLQLLRRRRPSRAAGQEAAALAVFAAGVAVALALILRMEGQPWAEALYHATLMALSAQTTTGLSSLDTAALPPLAWGVLMVAMVVGGNTGSTAGGLKTLRILLFGRLLGLTLGRTALPPNGVARLRLSGRPVGSHDLESAAAVLLLAVLTAGLSWLPFLAAGYGVDALFDILSAMATTGLSAGVAAPGLAPHLQAVLMADMVLGRLEFVAVLVLLLPSTWLGPRHVT